MRGNPRRFRPVDRALRSIPASAGEPFPERPSSEMSMVYPRECGGTFDKAIAGNDNVGLSPRVRGNLVELGNRQPRQRSIPASAGEPHIRRPQEPGS